MQSFKKYLKTTLILEKNMEDFLDFVVGELDIQERPKIDLVKNRDNSMTTANYCPNSKQIKVYTKGRAFFDIARSLAHELVHHMQLEKGKELNGETGSECENEANALAGKIIRIYGQKNPDFYE